MELNKAKYLMHGYAYVGPSEIRSVLGTVTFLEIDRKAIFPNVDYTDSCECNVVSDGYFLEVMWHVDSLLSNDRETNN
jgi:hypothetical protein